MNTEKYIENLENEERRARIQEWLTEDPIEKKKAKEKHSRVKKMLKFLKRFSSERYETDGLRRARIEVPEEKKD